MINVFFYLNQAWVVMVSAFLCNGIIFSILNSYGVLFVSLKDMYEKEGQGEAATRFVDIF